MNAGHATLIAELRDSETGAILARVADASRSPRQHRMLQVSSSVTNSADARMLISDWARPQEAARRGTGADALTRKAGPHTSWHSPRQRLSL